MYAACILYYLNGERIENWCTDESHAQSKTHPPVQPWPLMLFRWFHWNKNGFSALIIQWPLYLMSFNLEFQTLQITYYRANESNKNKYTHTCTGDLLCDCSQKSCHSFAIMHCVLNATQHRLQVTQMEMMIFNDWPEHAINIL